MRSRLPSKVLEGGDALGELLLLGGVARGVQAGHLGQGHLGDHLGLHLGEAVAGADLLLGLVAVAGGLEDAHDLLGVRRADDQAEDDVQALLGLLQLEAGAPLQDVQLVGVVVVEQLHHPDLLRLAGRLPGVAQEVDHLHRDAGLQLGVFVQGVEHLRRVAVALDVEHDAHAFLGVALVPHVRHQPVQAALVEGLDQAGLEAGLGDGGQLGDDQGALAGPFFELDHAPHGEAPLAGGQVLPDPLLADHHPPAGEVRALDVLHHFQDAHLGLVEQGDAGLQGLGQVVGGDAGGEADGDPLGRVADGGDAGREVLRLHHLGVLLVGGLEGDGLFLDVPQQELAQGREAHLGVAVGGSGVLVDGAEVALAVDQGVAHGELLGHAHGGVVDGGVAVGVVVTQHPAHHLGALDRGAGGEEAGDPHTVEDAPLDGLEAVPGVREGAVGDHGEAVGGEGALQEGPELLQLDLAHGVRPCAGPRGATAALDRSGHG